MWWLWLLVAPAVALALLSLRNDGARTAYASARLDPKPGRMPPASVIVPVKGHDPGLRQNLAALASLDYPDYELLVVARSAEDIPPGVLPSPVKVVIANGGDPGTSEKIQNLAAAIRYTRKRTEVLAFADSDGRVQAGWLRALVAALGETGVGAATGYRWYVPDRSSFWSWMRSGWNAVIAGAFGPGRGVFAWGGSMAIEKEAFSRLGVLDYWKNAVSDDYALSAAVRAAGLRIAWAPAATVVSTDSIGPAAFFEWTRRQLTITRVYAPRLWKIALAAHVVYCLGVAVALAAAALGYPALLWTLPFQLVPGMVKAYRRAALASRLLPGYRVLPWLHALIVPLVTWLWLISLMASGVGKAISWRGSRYRLVRPDWAR